MKIFRIATALILALVAVAGTWFYKFGSFAPASTSSLSSVNTNPSVSRAEVLEVIAQTADKSSIPKAIWLASGLTELEYEVLWEAGTERPGTSPLNDEKRKGTFVTKVCGLEVFSSEHKYDSGTGWPSFWEANKENIVLKEDYSWLGIKRHRHVLTPDQLC